MRKVIIVAGIAVLLLATIVQAAEYYTKHKGDHRRVEPEEGMALIYVFRPAVVGAAIKTWTLRETCAGRQ